MQLHKLGLLVFGASMLVPCARPDIIVFSPTGTSPNGLYSAVVTDNVMAVSGPGGTEVFRSGGNFFAPATTPWVNDFGQVVGYSEYGTGDPFLYFALYGSGGDNTGRFFNAGNGSGYMGTVPAGVFFGSLGWPYPECPDSMCLGATFSNGKPVITSLSDSGLVSGYINLGIFGRDYREWQLPNNLGVPEPSSLLLLGSALLFVFAGKSLYTKA